MPDLFFVRFATAEDVLDPDNSETGIYGSADAASYEVRGENYLVDKVKFPSRPVRMYSCVAMSCDHVVLTSATISRVGNVQTRRCWRVRQRLPHAAHGCLQSDPPQGCRHPRGAILVHCHLADSRPSALHRDDRIRQSYSRRKRSQGLSLAADIARCVMAWRHQPAFVLL